MSWILYAIYLVLFSAFAVSCHRLVLLGPPSKSNTNGLGWAKREAIFIGWLVGIYVIYIVFWILLIMMLSTAVLNAPLVLGFGGVSDTELATQLVDWTQFFCAIPALYLLSRIILVLPAAAIDQKVSIRWAWERSKRNGWRLVVVVGLLPWALSLLIGLLYRDGASAIETALIILLGVPALALEVCALSLSYRELSIDRSISGNVAL